MGVPVIIDTDIGDDIDDALALALAARWEAAELVAVTTVYQCAAVRARLAEHLLSAYGRPDVPVVAGADRPLLGALHPGWTPGQAAVLGAGVQGLPAGARDGHAPGLAVEAIVREGLKRPGLVLVTIGAMTNAALAFAIEPRLASAVRVVAMAGAWDRQGAEYNVACDPEAVAAVLASGAEVAFVGLDVTTRTVMAEGHVARLLSAGGAGPRALSAMLRLWQGADAGRVPVLHDPLALAAALQPDWLNWRPRRVAVELGGGHVRAQTCGVSGAPNALVADGVRAGFAEWFAERVCAG